MLSQIAIEDPKLFDELVKIAVPRTHRRPVQGRSRRVTRDPRPVVAERGRDRRLRCGILVGI
jgi:hypothetical protein